MRTLVADDMFIIVALPEAGGERRPFLLFYPLDIGIGGQGFECPHNFAQCHTVGASLVGAQTISIRFHTGHIFMGTHKGRPYWVRRIHLNTRPYGICIIIGNLDDGVKMVGHNHILMTYDVGISIGQPTIFLLHHSTCIVHIHGTIGDGTEQRAVMVHTDGDEIKPLCGIIVITQTDAATMMYIRVVCHILLFGHPQGAPLH